MDQFVNGFASSIALNDFESFDFEKMQRQTAANLVFSLRSFVLSAYHFIVTSIRHSMPLAVQRS